MWLLRAGEISRKAGDIFGLRLHGAMGDITDVMKTSTVRLRLTERFSGVTGQGYSTNSGCRNAHHSSNALRFRRDFEEAPTFLIEAEEICERHRMKNSSTRSRNSFTDIETELNAGQVASHTLPQLLCSLNQLLRYKSDFLPSLI